MLWCYIRPLDDDDVHDDDDGDIVGETEDGRVEDGTILLDDIEEEIEASLPETY